MLSQVIVLKNKFIRKIYPTMKGRGGGIEREKST